MLVAKTVRKWTSSFQLGKVSSVSIDFCLKFFVYYRIDSPCISLFMTGTTVQTCRLKGIRDFLKFLRVFNIYFKDFNCNILSWDLFFIVDEVKNVGKLSMVFLEHKYLKLACYRDSRILVRRLCARWSHCIEFAIELMCVRMSSP